MRIVTSVLTGAPVLSEAPVVAEDPVQAGFPVLLLATEFWEIFCSCRRSCQIMMQELWQNHAPADLCGTGLPAYSDTGQSDITATMAVLRQQEGPHKTEDQRIE